MWPIIPSFNRAGNMILSYQRQATKISWIMGVLFVTLVQGKPFYKTSAGVSNYRTYVGVPFIRFVMCCSRILKFISFDRYASYCANVGRTYFMDPVPDQEATYEAVIQAHNAAIAALVEGAPMSAAYNAAKKSLEASLFLHRLCTIEGSFSLSCQSWSSCRTLAARILFRNSLRTWGQR